MHTTSVSINKKEKGQFVGCATWCGTFTIKGVLTVFILHNATIPTIKEHVSFTYSDR